MMPEHVSVLEVVLVIILFTMVSMAIVGVMVYVYKRKEIIVKLDQWFTVSQPYFILTFLILFLVSVITATAYFAKDFLPEPASDHGRAIVPLFHTTTMVTGFTFFVTQILLFFFAFRYRTKAGRKARFFKNFLKLELFWIVVPAGMFLFLFIWGQILWAKIQAEPQGDVLNIDVMGEQFNWRVRYPGEDEKLGRSGFGFIDQVNDMGIDISDPRSQDDFLPVQMHIPKNRPVRLYMRSRDVIHSFFIPHLRVKMDALPGMITKVHFTANTTTAEMREKLNDPDFDYEVACAELCGRMHFAMKLILVVDEPEQFEKWYREQKSWVAQHPDYAKFAQNLK